MRLAAGLLLTAAIAAVAVGGSSEANPGRTQVVRWSPFDSSSHVKKSLRIKRIRGVGGCGDLGPGSEVVGDFGYRCGFGNFLVDPCWRDGTGQTNVIVCAENPWVRTVERVRVPHLLLRVGVTFGRPPHNPWGIELATGDHCTEAQGAHDSVKLSGGRILVVDYYCASGVVLLRNLRRTRPRWTIGSARYDDKHHRYRLLGRVIIRRAVLGGLPPAMLRQNEVAHGAAVTAIRIARPLASRKLKQPRLYAFRVRLALPAADWANVHVWADEPSGDRDEDWNVASHRVHSRWIAVQAKRYGPYCLNLPVRILRQLFDAKECARVR